MRRFIFLAATTSYILLNASLASAGEVMTDRCSAEVAIVPSYDAGPNTPGTIVLKRGSNGGTNWTPPFRVGLGYEASITLAAHEMRNEPHNMKTGLGFRLCNHSRTVEEIPNN